MRDVSVEAIEAFGASYGYARGPEQVGAFIAVLRGAHDPRAFLDHWEEQARVVAGTTDPGTV